MRNALFLWLRLEAPDALCFRLSVRSSVCPKPEIPSFHLYGSVGPTDQPWLFCSMSVRPSAGPPVRPSVRPSEEVSGQLPENPYRELPESLHTDVFWPHSGLIILWSLSVDFPPFDATLKRVKFGVSGHFPKNAQREWPEILHADVSWPPSEMIRLWLWFVDFCNFCTILT